MAEFDVNNVYGARALYTLYQDTTKTTAAAPELLATYEALPFIGPADDIQATGRWPEWQVFVQEVSTVWRQLHLVDEFEGFEDPRFSKKPPSAECGILNRWFNRILMLDIELQNGIFETFFAIYTELVRIDRENGDFDEGVENLNVCNGRRIQQVEIDADEVLCRDAKTGAETRYVRLRLDRGVSWEAAREMYDKMPAGSVEGFYAVRPQPSLPPRYILVKEREQVGGAGSSGSTWLARRRQRLFVIWSPDYGSSDSLQFYNESYFAGSQFERLDGSEEHLQAVEAGWVRSYEESHQSRLVHVHVLAGDVLTVWRLVKGGRSMKAKTEEEKEQAERLQVVRALTKPDNVPVVGVKVSEGELPSLRYTLQCLHEAAQEAPAETAKEIRDHALDAAHALLEKLVAVEDKVLPLKTWTEVHKILAHEGRATNKPDGMRGVQLAVEKLRKREIIAADGVQMKLLNEEIAQSRDRDELEQALFPSDFVFSGALNEDGEYDLDDEDFDENDEDAEGAGDGVDAHESAGEDAGQDRSSAKGTGRRSQPRKTQLLQALAPTGSKQKRGVVSERTRKQVARKERTAKSRARKAASQPDTSDGEEEDPFSNDGLDDASADDDLESLFSPAGDESGGPDLDPDAGPDTAAAVNELSGRASKGSTGGPALSPPAKKKAKTHRTQASAAPMSVGQPRWIYENIGKKLGIRLGPDVNSDAQGEYISSGHRFGVQEKVQGSAGDPRVYLKLSDGRGFVYDRSAKDSGKVVAREVEADSLEADLEALLFDGSESDGPDSPVSSRAKQAHAGVASPRPPASPAGAAPRAAVANDEGAPVALGNDKYAAQGHDGSSKYYCGRWLGRDAIPGTDGQCGPEGGPQCASCRRFQEAA